MCDNKVSDPENEINVKTPPEFQNKLISDNKIFFYGEIVIGLALIVLWVFLLNKKIFTGIDTPTSVFTIGVGFGLATHPLSNTLSTRLVAKIPFMGDSTAEFGGLGAYLIIIILIIFSINKIFVSSSELPVEETVDSKFYPDTDTWLAINIDTLKPMTVEIRPERIKNETNLEFTSFLTELSKDSIKTFNIDAGYYNEKNNEIIYLELGDVEIDFELNHMPSIISFEHMDNTSNLYGIPDEYSIIKNTDFSIRVLGFTVPTENGSVDKLTTYTQIEISKNNSSPKLIYFDNITLTDWQPKYIMINEELYLIKVTNAFHRQDAAIHPLNQKTFDAIKSSLSDLEWKELDAEIESNKSKDIITVKRTLEDYELLNFSRITVMKAVFPNSRVQIDSYYDE